MDTPTLPYWNVHPAQNGRHKGTEPTSSFEKISAALSTPFTLDAEDNNLPSPPSKKVNKKTEYEKVRKQNRGSHLLRKSVKRDGINVFQRQGRGDEAKILPVMVGQSLWRIVVPLIERTEGALDHAIPESTPIQHITVGRGKPFAPTIQVYRRQERLHTYIKNRVEESFKNF